MLIKHLLSDFTSAVLSSEVSPPKGMSYSEFAGIEAGIISLDYTTEEKSESRCFTGTQTQPELNKS